MHGLTKTRPRWAAGGSSSSAWLPLARRRLMVRRPFLAAGGYGTIGWEGAEEDGMDVAIRGQVRRLGLDEETRSEASERGPG